MDVHADHDHVPEVNDGDLVERVHSCGFTVARQALSPITSGSR